MDLIRKLREVIGAWITPAPKSEALVPVHIPNGTWKQVKVGDLTRSYLYTCKCLQLQELTPAEAKDGQIRKCGCGLKYSLLRDLALATDSTITEYDTRSRLFRFMLSQFSSPGAQQSSQPIGVTTKRVR